jgi:hypothetical protein
MIRDEATAPTRSFSGAKAMGLCLGQQTKAVLVRFPRKRSSIAASATYDDEKIGSTAFAPPGPHLDRQKS